MSSLSDVVAATCRIVAPSGRLAGSGFAVLKDGHVLTCHHVVRGLEAISVQGQDDHEPLQATYLADRSVPAADIAVLHVPGLTARPVQLGELRTGVEAYGAGFRPTELAAEPRGRVFAGKLTAGQELRLPPQPLPAHLEALPEVERPEWAREPGEYHASEVANFAVAGGLVQGISGGPVYDPASRRVVGLFRAIEGAEQAFVLSLGLLAPAWPDLPDQNGAEVADTALDALNENYGMRLVLEGARPQRPQPWRDFEPLLDLHRTFAGRSRELDRLRAFATDAGRDYLLVTGPSGYGKTALLANWALGLRDAGRRVAIHFITPRLDDALSARAVLGSLCRQLMALHGLGGDLPAEDRDLRHLFSDLLGFAPAAAGDVVVVLDGLDEAIGSWRPAGLFPGTLPHGLHVVLSARSIADTDWIEEAGLPRDGVERLALERLDRAEIGELVAEILRDGHGDDVVDRIEEVTRGDPFYVHDVLEDLARPDGPVLDRLAGYPAGHSDYLRSWWKEARARNPGPGFVDLMGTLAVARSPLGARELARIAPDDALTGADMDVLIDSARRYLEGSDVAGYKLAHGRIEELVQSMLAEDIGVYRQRLSAFCLRDPAELATPRERRYALRNTIGHLIEEGRAGDAYALLSEDWIARVFLETGSYRLLVDQLSELAEHLAATPEDHARAALVPALATCRETVRELISALEPDVLVAWTRLGGAEQVIEACRAMGPYRGQASEQLLAAAGALLDVSAPADAAAELAGRAIGMLPAVRTTLWMLERLDALAPILRHPALTDATRSRLVDQLAAVGEAMPAGARRALTLAHAAAAAAAACDDADRARQLADAAVEAAGDEAPGDLLLVKALALPALRRSSPGAVRAVVEEALLAVARSDPGKTLERDLTGRWLRSWREVEDGWAPELLLTVAAEVAGRGRSIGAALAEALCATGQGERALDLLGEALAGGDDVALMAVLEAAPALVAADAARANDLVARALHGAPPVATADCLARLDRWTEALAIAENPDVLKALAGHLDRAPAAATERISGLAAEAPDDQAELSALVAVRLAGRDDEAARVWLGRAMRHALADLPEGDSDRLRRIVAVAHVEAGEHDVAWQLAEPAAWEQSRVRAYLAMIAAGLRRDDAPVEEWASRLAALLGTFDDSTFADDALGFGLQAAGLLARERAELAGGVCRATEMLLSRMSGARKAGIAARLADVWWPLDHGEGRRLLTWSVAASAGSTAATTALLGALAEVEHVPPDELEQAVRSVAQVPTDSRTEEIEQDAARAAALARFARPEAIEILGALAGRLPGLAVPDAPLESVSLIRRLIGDLTGRDAGPLPAAIGTVTSALAELVSSDEETTGIARATLDAALAAPADDREAAVRAFVGSLTAAPVSASGLATWIPDALQAHLEPSAADEALATAVLGLAAADRYDEALAVCERMHAPAVVRERLEARREQVAARPDSALAGALLDGDQPDLALVVFYLLEHEGPAETLKGVLDFLCQSDFQEPRRRMLDDYAPLAVPSLLALGGTAPLRALLDAVEASDRRLVAAAAKLGAG